MSNFLKGLGLFLMSLFVYFLYAISLGKQHCTGFTGFVISCGATYLTIYGKVFFALTVFVLGKFLFKINSFNLWLVPTILLTIYYLSLNYGNTF